MNGIEKITARIIADAEAEAIRLKDAATADAQKTKENYDEECRAIAADAEIAANRIRDAIKTRGESAAVMNTRQTILRAKTAMLDEAYTRAAAAFAAADDIARLEFCLALTADALHHVLAEEADTLEKYDEDRRASGFSVVLSASDRAAFGGKFLNAFFRNYGKVFLDERVKNMTLADETGDFPTGVILRGGDVEHNLSLPMLIDAYRAESEGEVYGLLFPSA